MVNAYKKSIVKEIETIFQKKKTVFFYDFSNLSNDSVLILKKQIKQKKGSWKIYKNSLIEKALNIDNIKQNNALIFCQENEKEQLEILKTLFDFDQENQLTTQRTKMALIDEKIITAETLKEWSELLPYEFQLQQICQLLINPFHRLINLFSSIQKLE